MFRLMVSAGEASGDMHAAHALQALRNRQLDFECFGMGASKLAELGMELVVDCRELAVIGIVDVLINYPRFMQRLAQLRKTLRTRKPDLLIIVDYPDFNLKLAETAREQDVPVLFYISPQVWAWRSKRVTRIGKLINHMAVLFPFEVEFYRKANIPVTYVGHPLVDDAHSNLTQQQARQRFSLADNKPVVTLLPGSRAGEVKRNLPVMLASSLLITKHLPDCQFLLPRAATLDPEMINAHIVRTAVPVKVIDADAYHAMRAANAVVSASGTATLETALLGTPMAIIYVINPINYALMNRLIQIDDIGLVNIVAGKRIVQEFIQHNATPSQVASELLRLLNDSSYSDTMRAELKSVKKRMGEGGASQRVAGIIEQLLVRCS